MHRPLVKNSVAGGSCSRPAVFLAATLVLSLALTGKLPAQILVSDYVAGGDGTGTALDGVVGINADTGFFEFAHQNADITNTGDNPQAVDDLDTPFINSVFIIDQPQMTITTNPDDGTPGNVQFDFQPGDATGNTWNHIIKDVTHDIDKNPPIEDIWAGGVDTWTSAIGIHAAAGFTLELEEIRSEFGDDAVKFFSAFAGSDQCGGMEINLYAILSSEEEVLDSVSVGPITNNQGEPIQIEIPEEALYLTLATGASNDSIGCAHGVFAEPLITSFPTFPPLREATSPGDATACPPTGGGPITVTLSQEQADGVDLSEPITVTERVRGPITAADVTADGATITEVFPTGFSEEGFINTWLLLGPFSQPGGAAPGPDAIRLDYLTDGADIDEITVQPREGDTVETDFGGAAASTGLATTPAAINPGGVPTWTRHADTDDTINFNDYYGGDVNDIMMYGLVYVTLEEPLDLDIGLGSDDSIQVLLDGFEVHINDVGRGVGGANAIQDTVSSAFIPELAPLEAGTHTIMVKVFEGGGGHAFRLRFQDPITGEPVTEGISVCLDPEQDPCKFAPIGVDLVWNTTLGDLAGGLEYSIDLDVGTVSFGGEAGDSVIAGDGQFTLIVPPEDFGPIAGFDHAHSIGAPCGGTGVTEPDPGVVEIAGAGVDIWQGGDQFMFAYTEVTGDFRADVRVVDRQPAVGSRWGKHGIMARQDCSVRSRYSFTHDATGDIFTDPDNNDDSTRHATRPTHGGSNNFELTTLPGNPTEDVDDYCDGVGPDDGTCTVEHHDWLRLERFGNTFSSFSRQTADDPWVFLGSHDWGDEAPDTVQVGLAVTSHQGCEVTTIQFDNWELTPGTPPQRPLNLTCTGTPSGFDLAWENVGAGTGPVTISVNGAELETLPEDTTTATVPASTLLPGANTIAVTNASGSATCAVSDGEIFINAGGQRLDDALGTGLGDDRVWEEDTLANPSPFLASPNANTADFSVGGPLGAPILTADTQLTEPEFIDDPVQSVLFATERWDTQDIIYRIPVPQGSYNVQLLFAEGCCSTGCEDIADPEQSAGGCRVFDILVNGELVEDQFAQHVVAQRAVGNALPNTNWGVAVAAGPYEVQGTNLIEIVIDDLGAGNPPENASIKGIAITPTDGPPPIGFVRGDIDSSGGLNITDAIVFLGWQFLGDPPPPCLDAADVDDSGSHNITDAIFLLQFQFLGTAPPPDPGPTPGEQLSPADCGEDPTADDFDCAETPPLCEG